MHVVILGCGRVGSALARGLVSRGHSVAVIDQDAAAFHRLGDRFTGRTVTGVGFDRDTLVEAGVEDAQAFAAVSSGDNSNIISARLARETFGVPHVVARIYDPKRAEVYERLGIPTVATVRWAADQILRRLLPEHVTPEWTDASGHVSLFQLTVGSRWVGHRLSALEQEAGIRAGCISRFGDGFVPESRTVLQEGDLVHAIVMTGRLDEVESVVAHGPSDRKRS
ncbi:MAG: potassium channel family protein [Frankiaceae bacterium]